MQSNTLSSLFKDKRPHAALRGQELLMFDDEHVLFIRSGYIKRYIITREGDISVQSIYGPGQFFPLTYAIQKLVDEKVSPGYEKFYYKAITPAQLYVMNVADLKAECERDPLLYKEVLVEAAKRFRSNIYNLHSQTLRNSRWRLAHLLVYLAEEFGDKNKTETEITISLTRKDLATLLNISRETISRVMVPLERGGYVRMTKRSIRIPSVTKLREIYD